MTLYIRTCKFKLCIYVNKLSLLPSMHFNINNKCKICAKAKLAKTLFYLVERSTTPLELVHNDICNLKSVQIRGGKSFYYFY